MRSINTWMTWPIFLSCSWTWCIGMYLPVLLLDRYHWTSLIYFAVPNVLGVVLFGRFIRTKTESEVLVERHRRLLVWFSVITIAFHLFFLSWIWNREHEAGWLSYYWPTILVLVAAWLTTHMTDRQMRGCSLFVYSTTIVLLLITLIRIIVGDPVTRTPIEPHIQTDGMTIFLLAPMLFGFLLCPYADLTFHRAYQNVGGGSNGAITFLMFGLLFIPMIAFTVVYAVYGFTWLITIHLLVQSWFTIAVHLREIHRSPYPTPDNRTARHGIRWAWIAALLAAPLFMGYLDWFVFYGLIIPAALLLNMVRRRWGLQAYSSLTILLFIVVSLPFFALGFCTEHTWLPVIPIVLIVFRQLADATQIQSDRLPTFH